VKGLPEIRLSPLYQGSSTSHPFLLFEWYARMPGNLSFAPEYHVTRSPLAVDDEFEKNFRANYPFLWKVTLFGPLLLTLAILGILCFTMGPTYVQRLVATALSTFFFFGRFVILAGAGDQEIAAIQGFFSAEFLFLMVVYMDFLVATLLVFHASFLFRIPRLGSHCADLASDGHFILRKNPWIRRATFVGLIAFVTFPLASTGSVGGAVLSRILGMGRGLAFMGIMIGSVAGCGMMYFSSQLITRYLGRDNPVTLVAGILVIVLIIVGLNLWYRNLKRREGQESR